MSKKLKKKIAEIIGLNNLDWEARQERAQQILASTDWKQQICNELIGLSFRDLEQYLKGVASERQKREDNYERKLRAYREGKTTWQPKPLRRDMDRSRSNMPSPTNSKNRPRTLQEILAQVHAPRNDERNRITPEERQAILALRGLLSDPKLLQDGPNADDSPKE